MTLIERLTRIPAFLRFALVGGAGFVVNTGFLYLALHVFHLSEDVAWFFAFVPAVTFTWWGNRTITFHEHTSKGLREALHEWARFVATNSFGAVVNFATYEILVHWVPWPLSSPYVALACSVLAGMAFNFTLSKRFVFRPR